MCMKRCLWRAWHGADDGYIPRVALLHPLTCWAGKAKSPWNLRCWWWPLRSSQMRLVRSGAQDGRGAQDDNWEGGTQWLVARVSLQSKEGQDSEGAFLQILRCSSASVPTLGPAAHFLFHCHHLSLSSRVSLLPLWDGIYSSFLSLHLLPKGEGLFISNPPVQYTWRTKGFPPRILLSFH